MTAEGFVTTWVDLKLRQYLVDLARAVNRSRASQTQCLAVAWAAIGLECRDDASLEHCAEVGRSAMRRLWLNDEKWWRWRSPGSGAWRRFESWRREGGRKR